VDISAGILAGGKSARMGANKAFLSYKDSSFLESIAKECEDYSKIIISVNQMEDYRGLGYELVQDEKNGIGPLEGIYQILRKSQSDYVLILAADMPYVNRAFLKKFTSCLQDMDTLENDKGELPACVVLRALGMLEPLCSIYARKALPEIEKMREREEYKLRILFDRVSTLYIDIEALGYSVATITNINTLEEYQKLIWGQL
jgi:molybdopterin-guanine dinucleotide biosynthesis protein A